MGSIFSAGKVSAEAVDLQFSPEPLSGAMSAVMAAGDVPLADAHEGSALSVEAHMVKGHALMLRGELEKAGAVLERGLELSSVETDPEVRGRLLLGLGRVRMGLGAFDEAEGYFLKAIALRAQAGERLTASALNYLGQLERERGAVDRARNHFTQAIDLNRRLGMQHDLPELYHNLGVLERDEGNYPQALRFFERSAELSRMRGEFDAVAWTLHHRADTYQRMGSWEAAILQAEMTLELVGDSPRPALVVPVYRILADCYGELGQWERAFQMEQAYGQASREWLQQGLSDGEVSLGIAEKVGTQVDEAAPDRNPPVVPQNTVEPTLLHSIELPLFLVLSAALLAALVILLGSWRLAVQARANKRLRQMNAGFSALLEQARHRAEEVSLADRAKGEFLASLSHEIRTPLNAVVGMATVLRETRLTREQLGFLNSILSGCQNLLHTLNEILDYSKMESGELTLERGGFSPGELVFEIAETFKWKSREKLLKMETSIDANVPTRVSGDRARLRQILMNLVSNATKFTDKGSIFIQVRRGRSESDKVKLVFSVSDTGIGIPKEKQDKLFQPFVQLDVGNHARRGGTGLGLFISKRLAEAMDGGIEVESEPGAGACFRVTVRVAAESTAAHENPRVSPHLKDAAIALVDASSTNRRILRIYLEQLKAAVLEAESVNEAEAMIEKGFKPTVWILGERLEKDGFPRMLALLEREGGPVSVISLSSSSAPEHLLSSRSRISFSSLEKPVTRESLRRALERALADLEKGEADDSPVGSPPEGTSDEGV